MDVHWGLLLRILVGAALGGVIGYERHIHGRPAGLRTHFIVALASATFMVVSTNFVYLQHYGHDDLVTVDPSRIAASVVTGVGFLGGGAILRTGINVQGLTTAAGLWLVAAIGLSAGAGMYAVSGFATALGVGALSLLRRFERKDDHLLHRKITLVFSEQRPPLAAMRAALEDTGIDVSAAEYERHLEEDRVEVTFEARVPAQSSDDLIETLEALPGVRRVRVESVS